MFSAKTYIGRRAELARRVGSGLILLAGNHNVSYNYPNNTYSFRQDSTFLYYFGLNMPDLAGVVDAETGKATLFGNDFTVEDIIWTGVQPTLVELGAQVGVEVAECRPYAALAEVVSKALKAGRKIHFLPPYRGENKIELAELLGVNVDGLHGMKSVELMFAVAEMREVKSAEEIEAIERAFHIGYNMHTTAMRLCRAGVVEREIAGAIEGVAKSMGLGVSFPSIVTQHGETLHNLNCDGVLENGRLLLVDAGGESTENYCSDHTRTYPVSGKFSSCQRDMYNIVLKAHDEVPAMMKTGTLYADVHRRAYELLAEGLKAQGLVRGTVEDIVASGAMYMFMPHGLGHGMGMDVHDCEAIGERSFDFSTLAGRAAVSATCVHRATWRLRAGTVMSDEPGIYFIPALIDRSRAEGLYNGIVNWDEVEKYRNFGGIRIEDDILVTDEGGKVLGDKKIPVTVEELEAVVGK